MNSAKEKKYAKKQDGPYPGLAFTFKQKQAKQKSENRKQKIVRQVPEKYAGGYETEIMIEDMRHIKQW
jgi:hypothetical protein